MDLISYLLLVLGTILACWGFYILNKSKLNDKELCANKALSDEEFELLKNKKVTKLEKRGNTLFIITGVLFLPSCINALIMDKIKIPAMEIYGIPIFVILTRIAGIFALIMVLRMIITAYQRIKKA